MRFVTAICLVFVATISRSQHAKLVLDGHYSGENIYIQNPASSTSGFCTKKVLVNGKEIQGEFNSSAYSIELDVIGFKVHDSVHVEIFHHADCTPKLLQPWRQPIKHPSFKIVSIELDSAGILKWSTKKENTRLPYEIQQYRWNKWIVLGTVDGHGSDTISTYTFHVDIHSGENQFRVVQREPHKNTFLVISETVRHVSKQKKPEVKIDHLNQKITLDQSSRYQVYDQHGNLLTVGKSNTIELKDLCDRNTPYFLNYDNLNLKFIFQKPKKK